jgi:predicted benzoate:H+ symporter BenE
MAASRGENFVFSLRELSGALGDLGTLLPLMLGTIVVVGLPPFPVLIGFGLFYLATALVYRLPVPVQPMKAVAAVLLTAHVSPGSLAISGVIIGAVLLLLGVTGWIVRLARLVPQSVLAGLQLGLGVSLALASVKLLSSSAFIGGVTVVLLLLLLPTRLPSALIGLVLAVGLGQALGVPATHLAPPVPLTLPSLVMPTLEEMQAAMGLFVLPQLSLTLTNAVILTALIAHDYFGERAAHVTPARLSITSGLANLLLCPMGALPMCHGAGGLAAHYRFGARTGTALLALGIALLTLGFVPNGIALLSAIPIAGLGALLLFSAGELALTKRLFDCKPSCWPVIAATAAVTVWADPFWGMLVGSCSETLRLFIVRCGFPTVR